VPPPKEGPDMGRMVDRVGKEYEKLVEPEASGANPGAPTMMLTI